MSPTFPGVPARRPQFCPSIVSVVALNPELQRALDLYAAAAYWGYRQPSDQVSQVAARLLLRAFEAGGNAIQFDAAARYAEECAADGGKPALAEVSFEEFDRATV